MSKAQEWARKRNFMKFRLKGMLKELEIMEREPFTTLAEQSFMSVAQRAISSMLQFWGKESIKSKKEYLK